MISAPPARTVSGCTPLIAACVPTAMNAGVRTVPCAVAISPTRAAPSVAKSLKAKSRGMRGRFPGREPYHDFRGRKGPLFHPGDSLLHRLAVGRHYPGALQDVEPLLGG